MLDYDGDLYGEHVGVEFVQRLRPMAAFADVDGPAGGRWRRTSTRHPRRSLGGAARPASRIAWHGRRW